MFSFTQFTRGGAIRPDFETTILNFAFRKWDKIQCVTTEKNLKESVQSRLIRNGKISLWRWTALWVILQTDLFANRSLQSTVPTILRYRAVSLSMYHGPVLLSTRTTNLHYFIFQNKSFKLKTLASTFEVYRDSLSMLCLTNEHNDSKSTKTINK